ncbi:nuclear pore glycoprotein p62-like, partial [Argonauta hians]
FGYSKRNACCCYFRLLIPDRMLGAGSNPFGSGQATATPQTGTGGFTFGSTPTATPGFNASLQGGAVPRPFVFNPSATPTATGATPTQATPTAGLGGVATPSATPFTFSSASSSTPASTGPAFGSTPLAAPAASGSAPTGFGFSMATPTAAASSASVTKATPSTAPAPGGFSFGAAPTPTLVPSAAAPSSSSSTSTPAATTGLPPTLGQAGAKASFTFPTTTTTAATTGLSLGATTAVSTTTAAAPATGFSLGVAATTTTSTTPSVGLLGAAPPATTTTATAALSGVGTTTGPAAVTSGDSSMNFRQLEEQINKWSLELEEQEKAFLQQATQVNAWDRLLLDNGEKIHGLNQDVDRVKVEQMRLDNELDFIHSQQRELEDLLTPLEASVEQLPPLSYQHHADIEREHTYQLAESIDGQLKRMVLDLKEIIEHLNTTNSSEENTDPVHQITKILNAHMDSLRWIDQNAGLLNRRVEDISKQMELQRKEQERNYRLVFN